MYNIVSRIIKKLFLIGMIFLLQQFTVDAQSITFDNKTYNLNDYTPPPVSDPVCAYCHYKAPNHAANCPYYVAPKTTTVSNKKTSTSSGIVPMYSNDLGLMVAGTIIQSFFSAMMSSNAQQQQQQQLAEQQKQQQLEMEKAMQQHIKDSLDNLNYLKLMSSYKQLQGAQQLSLKASSSDAQLNFKTLDGDAETMRATAGQAFDGNITDTTGGVAFFKGTNFFGSNVAKTVVHPEQDSVMVDVHGTVKFLREHEAADSAKMADLKKKNNPENKNIDCPALQRKLNDYIMQRQKFQKTIISTQTDLDQWQQQNNQALWNAAMSGLDFAFGRVFDRVEAKGLEAEKFRDRFAAHMEELKAKGVDADNFLKTLDMRILNKEILDEVDISKFTDAVEYNTFVRDVLQSLLQKQAETDSSYDAMLKNQSVQLLLNDGDPSKDAKDFIVDKATETAIEKALKSRFLRNLLKFDNRIPYIDYAKFAVDEAYNAYDWYLSYQRIKDLHETSGKELQAAMSLQMLIDRTMDQVQGCPVQ